MRAVDVSRIIGIKNWEDYDWVIANTSRKMETDKRVEARYVNDRAVG